MVAVVVDMELVVPVVEVMVAVVLVELLMVMPCHLLEELVIQ